MFGMKYGILVTFLLSPFAGLFAQKPPIDSSIYGKWPHASGGKISNDGKYVVFRVSTDQYGYGEGYSVLKAVQGSWKFLGPGFSFTADGLYAYFKGGGDTLCKVALGGEVVERIPEILSYGLIQGGSTQWLVYRKKGSNGALVMQNMSTGAVKKYLDIIDYQFSEDGKVLILQSGSSVGGDNTYALRWEELSDGHSVSVWKGARIGDIHLDIRNQQLSFSTQRVVGGKTIKSYWYYKAGLDSATELINDEGLVGFPPVLQLGEILRFSKEGDRLFFYLTEKPTERPKPMADAVPVEVWSYRDEKLQSRQTEELKDNSPKSYLAVLIIAGHRIIRLQHEDESYINVNLPPVGTMADEFAITQYWTDKDPAEVTWNPNEGEAYMVSTKNGSRKPVTRLKAGTGSCCDVSPEGKYIVFYNADARNYFSYATRSGVIRNITKAVPVVPVRYFDYPEICQWPGFLIIGWVTGDSAFLLWDQYDIWEVDLAGNKLPVNLTNGYGRKHRISFQLGWSGVQPIFSLNERVLLFAFNQISKENGFYRLTIGRRGDPELVTMGPYIYNYPDNDLGIRGEKPIKAKDAQAWLVKRMSARESANYFWTSDLKKFVPVSDVHPERDWNWVSTELISWKTPDGSLSQGILYKPENFDSGKKYPIIFYYYQRLSDGLNACLEPGLSEGELNILWYVSNGYLVFTPDIYYTIGETGQSALNYIESAAKYLAKMACVDRSRIGLQGHSFGAIETNYIITHSHLFAAACSASGLSDFISGYGGIDGGGSSSESQYESGQNRMGVTLWQRPDLYIKNSAIFTVNAVTTPLLIMHTTDDEICPVANIKEFFIALRRLGKPVWMLLYGNASHSLVGTSSVDFTIRMQQFFDHYLRNAPMPKWMKEGIPARMKGVETGLDVRK
jgi:dienelactone hydrolase